jgi:hypothetical protein
MMPPLFAQFNEDLGNRPDAGRPADDFATYGPVITKSVAGVVSAYMRRKSLTGFLRTCCLT